MPPSISKSANNPLEIDTKLIPLEQVSLALGDIKSYGEHPLVSNGDNPPTL